MEMEVPLRRTLPVAVAPHMASMTPRHWMDRGVCARVRLRPVAGAGVVCAGSTALACILYRMFTFAPRRTYYIHVYSYVYI